MACRDMEKAKAAVQEVRDALKDEEGAGEVEAVHLNLASFASVRKCAKQLLLQEPKIHVLINNAGQCAKPRGYPGSYCLTRLVSNMRHYRARARNGKEVGCAPAAPSSTACASPAPVSRL